MIWHTRLKGGLNKGRVDSIAGCCGPVGKSVSLLNKQSALILVLALLAAAVLIGHQTVPPMDRDEARFAQASKQMLASGDYVTVRFQDELRAKKPAGIYWLQSFSAGLLGADDIAAYRLPSLLAFLAAIWGTYHLASHLYRQPRALLAAAVLGTSLLAFAESHLAKTDTVLMALCLAQQMALMRIYLAVQLGRAPPERSWLWFWVCMAAAIMIKGPIAPLLGFTTIAALCLWDRSYRWLEQLHFVRGFLVLSALTLPWAILVTLATDGAFLDIAVRGDFLAKVKAGQESHGAPIGTYIVLLGLLIWPGCILLPRAVAQMPTLLAHAQSRFLIAWIIPFWLLIELIPTKLPHYPLPVFPALAVLLVCAVEVPLPGNLGGGKLSHKIQRYIALTGEYLMLAVAGVLAAVVLWAAITHGGQTGGRAFSFAMICLFLLAVVLWQGILWHQSGGIRPVAIILLVGALFNFSLISGLLPALSRMHVSTAIDRAINSLNMNPAAIAAAGFHEPSLVFLRGSDVLLLNGSEAALFLAEAPGGLAIVENRQREAFLEMAGRLGVELLPPYQISGFNVSKGNDVLIFLYRSVSE
jgi:4-amino-4-deoxy-L-arabinose transferase-like glycosyltransferase